MREEEIDMLVLILLSRKTPSFEAYAAFHPSYFAHFLKQEKPGGPMVHLSIKRSSGIFTL